MHDQDMFRKSVKWHQQGGGSDVPRSPTSLKRTLGLAITVVLVSSLLLRLLVHAGESTTAQRAPAPTPRPTTTSATIIITDFGAAMVEPTAPAPTVAATATPMCTSVESYLTIISAQEAAGDYLGAATTAEADLRISNLCDYHGLTQKAISAGLNALYTTPFVEPLDTAAQQRLVNQYESLRARARAADIPIDSDLQIARRGFAISQFLVAKAALDHAYQEHQFNPLIDRDITQLYISTCYGLGAWYITAPADSPLYNTGLAWLATSHALAVQYHTGQGEAADKLRALVSPHEADWPAPTATALLGTQSERRPTHGE
jgi:hypothetical protein